jgi:radical SAM superfamily enzyme YgiQ (UPF0313 family)
MTKLALVSLSRSSNLNPPLGLLALASWLKRALPEVLVQIVDRNFHDIEKEIEAQNFDVVGISAMTPDYGEAVELAKQIKAKRDRPVLLGGVHVTTLPESFARVFDAGVLGEGEETLVELMSLFRETGGFPPDRLGGIEGLVFWDGERLVQTPRRDLIDLAKTPPSDWSFLHPGYFERRRVDEVGRFARAGCVMTSRGCPYRCSFCSTSVFWGSRIRYYPVERVVDEIRALVERFGARHITIWDDLFASNKARLQQFGEAFRQAGLTGRFTLTCDCRANIFDEESCRLLKEMGAEAIFFGFESGNERVLRMLKGDNVTIEDNRRAVELGVRYGFKVQGGTVLAAPTETIEEMRQTVDFIEDAAKRGVFRLNTYLLTPLPGTQIWEIALERGVVSNDMDWSLLAFTNRGLDDPFLLDESVDREAYRALARSGRLRRLKRRFQWNILRAYLKNDPVGFASYAIRKILTGKS